MTNSEFLIQYQAQIAGLFILVDGEECDLISFLYDNLIENDINHISQTDAKRIIDLRPGQSIFIGYVEIEMLNNLSCTNTQ